MARKIILATVIAFAALIPASTQAAVRITEFMYQGAGQTDREFFELTNIDAVEADVTGWSYNDDNPNNPVMFGSSFGKLLANESVILTELSADEFRSYWNIPVTVRIFSIGGNSNLGAADTINIYSSLTQAAATLVDSVSYSATTRGVSRNRPDAAGMVANSAFADSAIGDRYGSYLGGVSGTRDLANPGLFPFDAVSTPVSPVPEPATWALMVGGFGLVGAGLRRRRSRSVAAQV